MGKRSGNKYRGKNRKNFKPQGDNRISPRLPEDDSSGRGFNDVSWYTKYPQLAIPAGQLQYVNVPGMELKLGDPSNSKVYNQYVPGIMSLDWCPCFGDTNDPLNAVNLAGQEIYTKVRAAYNGDLDADSPDFLAYIGAIDSIYAYIGWLKRVYRCISTYSADNFQLPNTALTSQLRGQPNDVQNAILDLRRRKKDLYSWINELILDIDKFKCPAVMDLLNRHYWMSDNVYADSNSPRAQLYMYTLRSVYKFQMLPIVGDTSGNTAAGLTMVGIPYVTPANSSDYAYTLYTFGMSLINALDAWSDGYTISGYLRKAFDGTPNFGIAPLMENELLTATYSEEVLSQIENFKSLNVFGIDSPANQTTINMTVAQDVVHNKIVCNNSLSNTVAGGAAQGYAGYLYSFAQGNNLLQGRQFINVRTDNPSVGDTLVASRMCASVKDMTVSAKADSFGYTITFDAGTEVPLGVFIFTYGNEVGGVKGAPAYYPVVPYIQIGWAGNLNPNTGNIPFNMLIGMAMAESFDWHPISMFILQNGNSPAGESIPLLMGDVHNCAILTADQLHDMHRVCIFSELNAFSIM